MPEAAGPILEQLFGALADDRPGAAEVAEVAEQLAAALAGLEDKAGFESDVNAALGGCFPDWGQLERMVQRHLGQNLQAIVSAKLNLTDVDFQLVGWASAQGRMLDLLLGMFQDATDNADRLALSERTAGRLGAAALLAWLNRIDRDRVTLVPPRARQVAVVCLRGVTGAALVGRLARVLDARPAQSDELGALFVFGAEEDHDASSTDLQRAVTFAEVVTRTRLADAAGVEYGMASVGAAAADGDAVGRARTLARLAASRGVVVDGGLGRMVVLEGARPLRYDASPEGRVERLVALDGAAEDADAFALEPELPVRRSIAPPATQQFRGRAAQLDLLFATLGEAISVEGPAVCVVIGEHGFGKSRLRNEGLLALPLREPTASHVVVVRGDRQRNGAQFAVLEEAVAASVGGELARAIFSGGDAGGDSLASRDRQFVALGELFAALGRHGPVTLAVDDAHRLDASSLELIARLGAPGSPVPLAVWAFFREGPSSKVLSANVFGMVQLPPLDDADALALMREIAPAAPDDLLARAGGNPLYLTELARAYRQNPTLRSLPRTLNETILANLNEVPEPGRSLLFTASVLGVRCWRSAIEALDGGGARLPLGNVMLRRSSSRFPDDVEYAFRVPLYQEVAYQQLPEARRAELHRKAGEWLSGRPGVSPAELAFHFDRGNDGRAAAAYAAAAELSARGGAVDATIEQVGRVLALSDDPEVVWRALVARDGVLQLTSQYELQGEGVAMMRAAAERTGSLARQAEAAWRECYLARMTKRPEVVALASRAIDLARRSGELRWGALACIEMATFYSDQGVHDLALEHCEFALTLAEPLGDAWLTARVKNACGYEAGESGKVLQALSYAREAARGYEEAGDARRQAIVMSNAAFAMIRLGRLDEALSTLETAIETSRRVGNERTLAVATQNRATLYRIRGRWEDAARDLAQSGLAAERLKHVRLSAAVGIEQAYLALQTGAAPAELARLAQRAQELVAQSDQPDARASATAVRLRAGGGGATEEALAQARAATAGLTAEARAELLVAIYEAGGRREDDRLAAAGAIDAHVQATASPADEGGSREVFLIRYLAPEGLR